MCLQHSSDPEVKEIVSYSFLFFVVGSYVDCAVSNWDEKTNCGREHNILFQFIRLLSLFSHSVVSDSLWPMPGFPVLHYLPELARTHVHWVDDAIKPSHLLLPSSPPILSLWQRQSFFPMSQLFASGSQSTGVSASATVLPMNIQLIFFRIDWFHVLAVQVTLQSLFHHHSLKASILWCSAFLCPTLKSIQDYGKNHSFDYTDLY